jgi:hypothetical protein
MLLSGREEGCGLRGYRAVFFMTRAKKSMKKQEPPPLAATALTKTESAGKICQECPEWRTMKQRLRVSELLIRAIEGFESRLNAQDFKPTVSEYLKLLQLQQELDATEGQPREIKVTWVDPVSTSESEK